MTDSGGIAAGQLRSFVERIERLEEEKAGIADDIRAIYAEAKANGFDPKIMRQVVKLRKMDAGERQEQEAVLDLYLHALGMTPLEEHIAASEAAETDAKPKGKRSLKTRVGASVREAVAAMGEPVELTDEERAKGYSAAWIRPDGTRVALGADVRV